MESFTELVAADFIDGGSGEELVLELLDDESPFFLSPSSEATGRGGGGRVAQGRHSVVNRLISAVYSGPTISDIETALSSASFRSIEAEAGGGSSPMIVLPEKVSMKMDNKYTLKIKSSGADGLADDGYKWRKYGQKNIKNSPNPRSYYRCTNQRCNAKKQVERSTADPETILVTYEGLHLHYAYSHLSKKLKLPTLTPETENEEGERRQQWKNSSPRTTKTASDLGEAAGALVVSPEAAPLFDDIGCRHEGLLEDVVPLIVRNPCSVIIPNSQASTSSTSSSSSSSSISLGLLSGIF